MKLQQKIVDYIHIHKEHQTCKQMAIGAGVHEETMRRHLNRMGIKPKTLVTLKPASDYRLNHKIDLEKFYNKYYRLAFGLAMAYTKNRAEAGEVLSDTFLYLYRKWDEYDSEEITARMLIATIKRRAINKLKVRKRNAMNTFSCGWTHKFDIAAEEQSDEVLFYENIKIELIQKLIQNLSVTQQKVVTLKMRGLKEKDISTILKMRRSNISTHWLAALKKIRKEIFELPYKDQLILQL